MADGIVQSARQGRQDSYDLAGDITKKVRVDIPDFDGIIDPKVFSDWLAILEHYFDWYDMTDERKAKFAVMKLVGQAQIWWTGVEHDFRLAGQLDLMWEEMKLRLKRKYLPLHYEVGPFDDMNSLKQGGMTVAEYMNKFEELKIRCGGTESSAQALSRFRLGLRPEICKELMGRDIYTVDNAFQAALKFEKSLQQPLIKRFNTQVGEIVSRRFATNGKPYKSAATQATFKPAQTKTKAPMVDERNKNKHGCFKCCMKGHMARTKMAVLSAV